MELIQRNNFLSITMKCSSLSVWSVLGITEDNRANGSYRFLMKSRVAQLVRLLSQQLQFKKTDDLKLSVDEWMLAFLSSTVSRFLAEPNITFNQTTGSLLALAVPMDHASKI